MEKYGKGQYSYQITACMPSLRDGFAEVRRSL